MEVIYKVQSIGTVAGSVQFLNLSCTPRPKYIKYKTIRSMGHHHQLRSLLIMIKIKRIYHKSLYAFLLPLRVI